MQPLEKYGRLVTRRDFLGVSLPDGIGGAAGEGAAFPAGCANILSRCRSC
jgi:hypothetical protein